MRKILWQQEGGAEFPSLLVHPARAKFKRMYKGSEYQILIHAKETGRNLEWNVWYTTWCSDEKLIETTIKLKP